MSFEQAQKSFQLVTDPVGFAADRFTDVVVNLGKAAAYVFHLSMTAWLRSDMSSILSSPVIGDMQRLWWPAMVTILVGSVMWQGIVLMWQRKADPLARASTGLVVWLAVATLGPTIALLLFQASHELSVSILDTNLVKFTDGVGNGIEWLIDSVVHPPAPAVGGVLPSGIAIGLLLLVAPLLMVLSLLHWIMSFLRLAGLVLLVAMLPTAAAGQLNEATKPWMRRVIPWIVGIEVAHPIAATGYAAGGEFIGSGMSELHRPEDIPVGLQNLFLGFTLMILAILALPAIVRLFDWGGGVASTVSTGHGGGSGAAALAAAAPFTAQGVRWLVDSRGPGSGGAGHGSSPHPPVPAHLGGPTPDLPDPTLQTMQTGGIASGGQPRPAHTGADSTASGHSGSAHDTGLAGTAFDHPAQGTARVDTFGGTAGPAAAAAAVSEMRAAAADTTRAHLDAAVEATSGPTASPRDASGGDLR